MIKILSTYDSGPRPAHGLLTAPKFVTRGPVFSIIKGDCPQRSQIRALLLGNAPKMAVTNSHKRSQTVTKFAHLYARTHITWRSQKITPGHKRSHNSHIYAGTRIKWRSKNVTHGHRPKKSERREKGSADAEQDAEPRSSTCA